MTRWIVRVPWIKCNKKNENFSLKKEPSPRTETAVPAIPRQVQAPPLGRDGERLRPHPEEDLLDEAPAATLWRAGPGIDLESVPQVCEGLCLPLNANEDVSQVRLCNREIRLAPEGRAEPIRRGRRVALVEQA